MIKASPKTLKGGRSAMTETAPVLVSGRWRPAKQPAGTFRAFDPSLGEPLDAEYPVSDWADIEEALGAAAEAAWTLLALGYEPIAAFFDRFASLLEASRDKIVETTRLETGLPAEPRLRSIEFPRQVDQLRQTAQACRERSWRMPTIDTKRNIRSIYGPLGGPVAVFSPNNFPLAFNSVGGGDFAAALAAGNPVIAKANPSHPATTRILADIAFKAAGETGLPQATIQLIYHFSERNGFRLVSHPLLAASAFTGSRRAGLALKEAADRAGKLIYLEMSSTNPVFILPGALEERGPEIASELFNSCTLGEGQFCTRPVLTFVPAGPATDVFVDTATKLFESNEPGFLLGPRILEGMENAVRKIEGNGGRRAAGGYPVKGPGFRYASTLFIVSGDVFLADPRAFEIETFGPLGIIVTVKDASLLRASAEKLSGQLTVSVYSSTNGSDEPAYRELEPLLRVKAGRLLNDRMPTGVAVSPAMGHGGPFPATGHPGFTSVGLPASIRRFAGLHCYDNVRQDRLPAELRDKNPGGKIWRFIDGGWMRTDV
jgi:NADP-dependent aldehyde dehydrogenase